MPTLAPESSGDSSEVPTLALTEERKAKLASLFSAESKALPMLAPRDTNDPHAPTTISFWAPDTLIEQCSITWTYFACNKSPTGHSNLAASSRRPVGIGISTCSRNAEAYLSCSSLFSDRRKPKGVLQCSTARYTLQTVMNTPFRLIRTVKTTSLSCGHAGQYDLHKFHSILLFLYWT
jgi:hypothetical protein